MGKPVSIGFQFQNQPGPIPLSELDSNFTALANTANDFATYGNFLIDSSGAPNVITVTTPVTTTFTYVAGQFIQVQIANSSTGAVSINVNGLGSKAVINADGTALLTGAFIAGQILLLQYDGTSFRTLGAQRSGAGSGVTSITGTANQIAASASTGAVTLSLPQNVVIPTPAGGVGLAVTGVSTGIAFQATSAGATGICINADSGASTTSQNIQLAASLSTGGRWGIGLDGSVNLAFSRLDTPHTALTLSLNGEAVINAPISGVALAITGGTGNTALTLNAGTGQRGAIFNGVAGAFTLAAFAPNTASNSFGLQVRAGTNSSDLAFSINNAANTLNYLEVDGAGSIIVGAPTGGAQGIGTLNATGLFINGVAVGTGVATTGSFSAGTTGLSGATIACNWTKVGTAVIMRTALPSTIVSNGTGFTITGLPATIQPTTAKYIAVSPQGLNNSAVILNMTASITTSVITLLITGNPAGWTGSGNKNCGDTTLGTTFTWDTN